MVADLYMNYSFLSTNFLKDIIIHTVFTVPPAFKLTCGVYPERIGNASRVNRECIQSAAFLLECHSNWSFWNAVPYYVSAPMERSRDHSKDSDYRYRALHSG